MILLKIQPCDDNSHVASFCESFISSRSNDLQLPFIIGDDNLKKYIPDDFAKQCNIVRDMQSTGFPDETDEVSSKDNELGEQPELTKELLYALPTPKPPEPA